MFKHLFNQGADLMGSAAKIAGLGPLNVNAMRPYIDENGDSVIAVNGRALRTNTPATLRYDEWKDIDRQLIEVAVQRLVGIKDLLAKGLTHSLGSIGQTISLWERSSNMTPAEVSMSGITPAQKDTPNFDYLTVPVPIIHKDFDVNIRRLEASRMFGEGIDVTAGSIAARVVSEASEDMLFAGNAITVDGGTIYGYTNHPDRKTVAITTAWDNAGKTGAQILGNVQAGLKLLRLDRHYGPYCIYVPTAYEGILDNDFNPGTSDTRTIRQRLLALANVQEIKVADRLAADNVLIVQMTRDVVDLAMAQDITTVQWPLMGGMQQLFKVMAIWVPRVKSDFDLRSGVCHIS